MVRPNVRPPRLFPPISRFVVRDLSMRPTLAAGDRLVVWRWAASLGGIRRGDLVVIRDPELPGLHLVKRVAATPGDPCPDVRGLDGYAVLGDDPETSRDSRAFGRVRPESIVGRVVWRYLPANRRGPVGRPR